MSNKLEQFIWSEKYRPNKIDDIVIPERIREQFRKFISEKQIPNLLLTSPTPGTGKTTTAHALCAEMGIRPLFINASLENSIDDIRSRVISYATTVSLTGDSTKVVIFDEAERLSPQAQDSLKAVFEMVSANCRFILTCNTKSRIIEPLHSRLSEVDFNFSKEDLIKLQVGMMKRVFEILIAEGVLFKKEVVAAVIKRYVPDNRKLLNVLQQYASQAGTIDEGILGHLASGDSTALIEAMKAKKFNEVKTWCFENADRLNDDFYGKLFRTLEPVSQDQSVPQMILDINDAQRWHSTVPDKFLHFAALATTLMMNVQFK